mmetsp:Transcript_1582/g.4815  ORF Transcript_1582/g.4815 Transcript_1582/m.4815 type:complete len:117 (-) Transcript_1582:601-951(-)
MAPLGHSWSATASASSRTISACSYPDPSSTDVWAARHSGPLPGRSRESYGTCHPDCCLGRCTDSNAGFIDFIIVMLLSIALGPYTFVSRISRAHTRTLGPDPFAAEPTAEVFAGIC